MNTNDSHALPGTESADKETRQQVQRMWLFTPSILLRLEGLVVLTLSAIFYAVEGGNWWLYLLLFLSPDLSMLGYLAGNRLGALCYNLVHTSVLPLALLTVGLLTKHMLIVQLTLIWLSHIGFDRVLAYGLKYPTAFQDTHFNRI